MRSVLDIIDTQQYEKVSRIIREYKSIRARILIEGIERSFRISPIVSRVKIRMAAQEAIESLL